MKKLKIILTILLFFVYSLTAPGGYVGLSDSMIFNAKKIVFYIEVKDKKFSEELLKECMYYEQIYHSDVVLLQSKLETGNYASVIFQDNSNLFGMKYPRVRETTASGIMYGHAYYDHWTDSVKDYKLFQDWYMSIGYDIETESDDYLVFLKWIRYASDKKYIHKLIILDSKDIA